MTGGAGRVAISGYRRPDGRLGVRNYTLVLGINGLASRVAERISRQISGAICAATTSGRGQVEPDLSSHHDQLVGLGANPNVGAVLVVGVDRGAAEQVAGRIAATGKPVDMVTFAEAEEDVLAVLELGIRRAAMLVMRAAQPASEPGSLADLVVGVECGHSDSSSGISANPVVGAAVDRLVDHGATVILGETIEWLGAEHLLARRARTPGVARDILAAVERREQRALAAGKSLTGNNPGEENIQGGLSTIEEKSLGAVIKSGTRSIESLLGLAQRPGGPGLHLMDGPSFSPESLTGFAAAGAQAMLFTTGPGNSFVSAVAPTLKITGRPGTAARLAHQIDFDASAAFLGTRSVAETADALVETLIAVCNGKPTWGEILGEGLEVPTRLLGSL